MRGRYILLHSIEFKVPEVFSEVEDPDISSCFFLEIYNPLGRKLQVNSSGLECEGRHFQSVSPLLQLQKELMGRKPEYITNK